MISPKYRKLIEKMHQTDDRWGRSAAKWAHQVTQMAKRYRTSEVLDYGCGKGTLARAMKAEIQEYDPGIPEKSILPVPSDIVVCVDVMEHVEEEFVPDVIAHLHSLTKKALLIHVSTRLARKKLPDGSNAHLTVKPMRWWANQFGNYFKWGIETHMSPDGFTVWLTPLEFDDDAV